MAHIRHGFQGSSQPWSSSNATVSKKTAEYWASPEGIEALKRRQEEDLALLEELADLEEEDLAEQRRRQKQQRGRRTATKARRSEKAAAALSEDGFALHPLDEADDSATWRSLAQFLLTSDPAQLGKGKDATRSFGEYNELRLVSAWKIEHPRSQERFNAARKHVIEDMELLSRKGVHPFGALPGGLPVATTAAAAAFDPESRASEAFCLHGTSAPALLSLLANGVNERYSGSNAGTSFGDGIYLAEDVAKSDQYCAPDAAYDPTSELHRRLYGDSHRHRGCVFYVLVCRVLLGYPARTQQAGQNAFHMETGEPLFPVSFRELANIPNVSPPKSYHSLIVERGAGHVRYREFILFHGEYVYPEYLLAYHRCFNDTALTAPAATPNTDGCAVC